MAKKKVPKSFKKAKKIKAPAAESTAQERREKMKALGAKTQFQEGNTGRPKGSRNRFSEAFIKDFLADWEENGLAALKACRAVDVAAYINAAVKIIPKEFNLNSNNEAELEKFLERYDDKQLQDLLAGLVAIGESERGSRDKASAPPVEPSIVPDKLH